VADCGDGVSAICTWVQLSVSADNGWPHNALRRYWLLPISCKSAAGHEMIRAVCRV